MTSLGARELSAGHVRRRQLPIAPDPGFVGSVFFLGAAVFLGHAFASRTYVLSGWLGDASNDGGRYMRATFDVPDARLNLVHYD